MSESNEHRKAVARAYQAALARLRARHDDEFHEILAEVYAENGLTVVKRRSRIAANKHAIEKAKRFLEEHGVTE